MCGIAGFLTPKNFIEVDGAADASRMRDSLSHRGPDDSGLWLDVNAGIVLAHRRLSILDLSDAGHQPMHSPSGRYVIVFNGEIYNHQDLRRKLEERGCRDWRGHSDTETLLAAIEWMGLEKALQASIGMFALALWDRQERVLSLARDRMGEKPLFYGWQGGTLLFGSELKALQAHPDFRSKIESDVLPLYLRHGYIPAPWCVWNGIRKLLPGCIVQLNGGKVGAMPEPKPYWKLAEAIAKGQVNTFQGTDKEAIDLLEAQLSTAVFGQMIADVPLGAFLSGGIDSTTVVALMQAQSSRPIKTFTIGFEDEGYNEANHAKVVAAVLGTDHTELYITSGQALDIIPQLPVMYDEPFGDSSAIPTHLVAQLARRHVAVSLSGDGGDELFGGYGRYFNHKAERIWKQTHALAAPLRGLAAGMLHSPATILADRALQTLATSIGRPLGQSLSAKAALVGDLFECDDHKAFYRAMTSQWSRPPISQNSSELPYGVSDAVLDSINEPVQKMMATDCLTYLPDDILAKVDRAAMAVSLETRVPLLDHRIVELAWSMPYTLKVRDGQGKWLLRQLLYRYVPRQMIERPKMGFGVPVDEWVRGPLRDWAEYLLDEDRLQSMGLFDSAMIRRRWREHMTGRANWRDSIWAVLMWQSWCDKEGLLD
tara:strand:- start:128087 stop:130048 length:1962 start_codon:yes stop_codon:yes gene_type:complete